MTRISPGVFISRSWFAACFARNHDTNRVGRGARNADEPAVADTDAAAIVLEIHDDARMEPSPGAYPRPRSRLSRMLTSAPSGRCGARPHAVRFGSGPKTDSGLLHDLLCRQNQDLAVSLLTKGLWSKWGVS
jgi:hypothetical protein